MTRQTTLVALAFALAGCAPGAVGSPGLSKIRSQDVVTIKGSAFDPAGKPLAGVDARVGRAGAPSRSVAEQFSDVGDNVELDDKGAFSLKKQGRDVMEVLASDVTARHWFQVARPDGGMARVYFYPSAATVEVPPLTLWDVQVDADAKTGALGLTMPPPKGGKAVAVRVYRGEEVAWEQDGVDVPRALPAYLFLPGVAYRFQAEATVGETHIFKSVTHAFTGSDLGRTRVLPVAAATDEAGAPVTAWSDGEIANQPLAGPAAALGAFEMLVTPMAKDVVYDLGASKRVERLAIFGPLGLKRVVVGDAADGTGGRAFTPTGKYWQDLVIGATGRYVRLERGIRDRAYTPHEVRVIGPEAP